MSAADISVRLASLADSTCIVSDPGKLAAYQIGGATPSVALRPTSVEQLAEILKFAAAKKLTIIPRGAGTKSGMTPQTQRYDIALELTALDRIAAYDPADLTLSVQPGVPLQRLAGVLAGHRQFLPLQVPFWDRATVGGTLASGVDSPLRQSYGTARDFLLGMEFVTGDGRVVKSGGRVVKNVSGYDLHKLMIGAFGTLGIITKINFRTFPAPTTLHGVIAFFETIEGATEMRGQIAASHLRPLSLEILNPMSVGLLFRGSTLKIRHEPTEDFSPPNRWAVVASFSGNERVLARYERELRGVARATQAILLDEETAPAVLARIREFISIALGSLSQTTILKIGVLPTDIDGVLRDAASIAGASAMQVAAMARGVGVIYLALRPDAEGSGSLSQVIATIFRSCEKFGCHAEILWRALALRELATLTDRGHPNFTQMRNLKKVFDPENILAPDAFSRWMPHAA